MAPRLLLEALAHWVTTTPDKVVFTYLQDNGSVLSSITYKELDVRTAEIARYVLDAKIGLKKGDRALLVFEPSISFIISFIACVRAGVIAVPVFPPDPMKKAVDMSMFATITANCGATVALTSAYYNSGKKLAAVKSMFSKGGAKWPDLQWVVVDDIPSAAASDSGGSSAASTGDICFLQYTSGSTSDPKGVMISHENLAHNLSCIIDELKAGDDTVVVSWLPQYHDMGLIGSYLGCLYCGGSGFYMSPFAFVKQPLLWLQLVSKHRGTHLQGPNFAYALTARRFRALKKPLTPPLDLSCIRHMINAAEPVMEKDLLAFKDAFAPLGLRDGVLFPTYGLAEHTVLVCSGGTQRLRVDKRALEVDAVVKVVSPDGSLAKDGAAAADLATGEDGDAESTVIIGCGYPHRSRDGIASVEVVIVAADAVGAIEDAKSDEAAEVKHLGEDKVGEIWVHSPSKACGYWGNEEKSTEDFGATLTKDAGKRYLRTGDLGFLHAEELFICGRLKDLIIIRGRNHYPQDIERCVEATTNKLRPGRSAAFAVELGSTEHIAVVSELRENESKAECAKIVETMRAACAKEQGAQLGVVYLCKDRTVPITTSGKIARRWCKRSYDNDSFQTIFRWVVPENADDRGAEDQTEAENEDGDKYEPVDCDALGDDELLETLVRDIGLMANYEAEELLQQTDVALVNLGLDSMTLAQLVEMLKLKYSCQIPEQWIYFESTNISQVIVAIRNGGISEEEAQEGQILEVKKEKKNELLEMCPCFLMCCPGLVLGR